MFIVKKSYTLSNTNNIILIRKHTFPSLKYREKLCAIKYHYILSYFYIIREKALTGSSLMYHCNLEAGEDFPEVQFKLNLSPV